MSSEEIIVLRNLRIRKGAYNEFCRAGYEKVRPYYEKAGVQNLGMWQVAFSQAPGQPQRESAEYDEVTLLTRYASLDAWQATRFGEINKTGGDDEALVNAREGLAIMGSLCMPQDPGGQLTFLHGNPASNRNNNFARPVQPDQITQTANNLPGEIAVLRYFRIKKGAFSEFYNASADKVWPYYEKAGARIFGMWQVVYPGVSGQSQGESAEYDEVYLLTRYASLDHWQATRLNVIGKLGGYGEDFVSLRDGLLMRTSLSLPQEPAGQFTVLYRERHGS